MAKRKEIQCTKEAELAILRTDSEWIKTELKETVKKLDKMLNILSNGEGKISKLNKSIYGNGKEGIVDIVKSNHDYIISQKAQIILIKTLIVLLSGINGYFVLKLL